MLKILFRTAIALISLVLILSLGIVIFIKTSPQFGSTPSGSHLEKIKNSVNYGEDQFKNLIPTSMDMNFSSGIGVMYEWIFNTNGRVPNKPLPVEFDVASRTEVDTLSQITWFGHSAILLEIDGKKILIDPMLGNASAPVSFMTNRFDYEVPIDFEKIPNLDAIILSHDHYDHLDYPSIMKLKDRVGHFFTPLGVGSHLKSWGIDKSKITEMDWWETVAFDELEIIATPARHFSGRGLSDRNKTQWASWIIKGENENIYFSGDSGYGPHFKEIGDRFGPIDFAMMECGQYNEQWAAIHMMPEETIQASIDLKSKRMMPIHWSAFNLSLHTWTDPVERATKAAQKLNVNILTPRIGQRFSPSTLTKNQLWWRELE